MSGTAPPPNPPVRAKRGVGLSGIVAGNTGVTTTLPCQAKACPSKDCGSPCQWRLI